MAIEEVSFTNTNGEEITLSNLVNQMINYYSLKLEYGETRITDFREGSEIRNLLEAFAVGIYALLDEQQEATKIAFISSSYGTYLDQIGEMPFINLPRITGDYAKGTVTFSLSEKQDTDIVIPEETIVACSDTGIDFATTTECIIERGALSEDTAVECITVGEDGNVDAQTIDTIVSDTLNLELLSVSNEYAMSEGTDEEDDEVYRERLLENVQADGFGTLGWYENLCENVDGVHDVLFVDDEEYTKKVLVNADNKPTSDVILLEVLTKLTDLDNIVLNHSFNVDAPVYNTVNLEISLNVTTTIETRDLLDTIQALFDGGSSITQEEFDGLNINEEITRDDIISTLNIFDDISEVTSIKQDSTEITTITPSLNGVLKLGLVTFNQTEV